MRRHRNDHKRIVNRIIDRLRRDPQLRWLTRWYLSTDQLEDDVAALLEDGVISDPGTAHRHYQRVQSFLMVELDRQGLLEDRATYPRYSELKPDAVQFLSSVDPLPLPSPPCGKLR